MLVGMAVRAMGKVCQGLEGAVVPFAPAVDILPVQVVADGGLYNTYKQYFHPESGGKSTAARGNDAGFVVSFW